MCSSMWNAASSRTETARARIRYSLRWISSSWWLPAGKGLRGEARGTLLTNTFSMSLSGATLSDLMQEANAPIDFNLQAGSASAQVHAVLQPPAENTGSAISFRLDAPHSSEVSSWLGLRPGTDVQASVKGDFHLRKNGWQLSGFASPTGTQHPDRRCAANPRTEQTRWSSCN